jgi:hypothetical protein
MKRIENRILLMRKMRECAMYGLQYANPKAADKNVNKN